MPWGDGQNGLVGDEGLGTTGGGPLAGIKVIPQSLDALWELLHEELRREL